MLSSRTSKAEKPESMKTFDYMMRPQIPIMKDNPSTVSRGSFGLDPVEA